MTKINYKTNISQNTNHSYVSLIIWAAVFFVLLMLRDAYSVAVNKNLFIVITFLCVVSMKTNNLIYLFCFLFPLYVGLPGNYMTLILLARLLFCTKRFKASSFIISLVISVYILIQNMVTGYTGVVPMMFIAAVFLVLFLFTGEYNLESVPLIVSYAAGVAALGYIMLLSTLNVYDLSDLMTTSFRLGSSNVDYVEGGIMNVSIDPNFYGVFVISSIALALPLAVHSKTKPFIKICLWCFSIIQVIVCLIGLSRAFIIIFVAWIILYLISQKKVKRKIMVLLLGLTIVALVVIFIPNVLETALARFEDSDMATGNGRITLINYFFDRWDNNISTILFGVGLFRCNVHCMPLQFLFGGGLVLFVLMIALVVSFTNSKVIRMKLSVLLPLIITFAMMCTVPAAGLLNFMFPLVLVGLTMRDTRTEK